MKAFVQTLTLVTLASAGFAFTFPTSAPASTVAGKKLDIDASHSAVIFRTKHLGVSNFYGRFNDVSGQVVFDKENPEQSSITVEVKADSIDTNSKDRDQHLRSPDFFSAKENPLITFVSSDVRPTTEGMVVAGELTLNGVSQPVMAQTEMIGAADTAMGYRAGFEANFTIDLTQFNMTFMQQRPGALGPEVDLTISLECVPAE